MEICGIINVFMDGYWERLKDIFGQYLFNKYANILEF